MLSNRSVTCFSELAHVELTAKDIESVCICCMISLKLFAVLPSFSSFDVSFYWLNICGLFSL